MIITKTPVRISFLGGGTDYPEYFRNHGGQVLGAGIDKYSYLTVNRLADLFDYSIRVSYSRTELANSLDEIEHPSVRECLRFMKLERGIEINYVGDLPARSGLGSSSSFTVGLLHALHSFKGERVTPRQLAEEAIYVEQEMIRERVGVQDQFLCAHGGLLHLHFDRAGKVAVNPLPLRAGRLAELQANLMLFYTGINRKAHEVLGEQLEKTKQGAISSDLGELSNLVDEGLDTLASDRPISDFGELLHAAWSIKRGLSTKISNSVIDDSYARARSAGAIGGKLLGAGGGGFLLLFARPQAQDGVSQALGLSRIRFSFEHTGSTLLFYQPQQMEEIVWAWRYLRQVSQNRFLIVDSGMRSLGGHNFSYTRSVESALKERAFEVTVLALKQLAAEVSEAVEARRSPHDPFTSDTEV